MGNRLQMRIENHVKHLRWSIKQKINGFYPWTVSAKHFTLDVWHGSDYASGLLKLLYCDSKRDILENWYMPKIYSLQTKNFPLFWGHSCKYNIQAKEKTINHWIWCFCSLFYFLNFTVPDNNCDKQKWYVLFFTCFNIVVHGADV